MKRLYQTVVEFSILGWCEVLCNFIWNGMVAIVVNWDRFKFEIKHTHTSCLFSLKLFFFSNICYANTSVDTCAIVFWYIKIVYMTYKYSM